MESQPEQKHPWQTKHFAFTFNKKDEWGEAQFTATSGDIVANLRKICKHFIFQLERGETGRLHYQGYIELSAKKRLSTLIPELQGWMQGVHVSICSTVGKQALQQYCMKMDTRVDGPWTDAGRPSVEASLLLAEPFDGHVEFNLLEDVGTRRSFQESLRLICLQPPHPRNILWVGDTLGNSGKTEWADWMEWKYGAVVTCYGCAKDIMSLIMKQPASKCYIFNLPRSRPNDAKIQDLYNVIEMVKDGKLINLKYETAKMRIQRPHVIVLANYFPDHEEQKMVSRDRWRFLNIRRSDWSLQYGSKEHPEIEAPVIPVIDFKPIDEELDELRSSEVLSPEL